MANAFFPPDALKKGEKYARFVCYRFHSRPGIVVKTLLAFKAPTAGFPGVAFTHVFLGEDREAGPRTTRGIVLPGREYIYCLGAMMHHEALKVLLLDRPRGTGHGRLFGLTLSMDEEGPIAARVLLKRTNAANHAEAEVGLYDVDDLRKELGEDLQKLRNRIDFRLEDAEPVHFKGRPIGQEELVDEVRRALRVEQAPLFTREDRSEFNPAATEEYTFNAALGIWSGKEGEDT